MLSGETAAREEAPQLAARPATGPVVLRAEGISKGYPRAAGRGAAGRLLTRFGGIADVVDEDEDEDVDEELDEEERAAGWVVRDVDIELRAGTSTGVVGPGSSGKTTLFEVLAGLTPPTSGTIVQAGRVVPILDALPKLMQDSSAWRNVVLLARVLGLSRRWARRRIEPIFEFAGLTGSEDRPRKAMASAEVQRLAVATMLHVDGVAYLVDSSLGGRDRDFRERCLARLAEKRAAGAAIVHAARELEGVQRLCDEVLWLERGAVVARGRPDEVAAAVGRRRAARRRSDGGPVPTRETEQLLDFLRAAIGDVHAHDALHAAAAAARAAGEERIGWAELAVAAGYDVAEAQRIVDRLARRAGRDVPIVPGYDARAAILGAAIGERGTAVVRVDGETSLRVLVEAAVGGIAFGCAVVLAGEDDRRTRLDQPEPFVAERPGVYEAEVVLPPGTLREGAYRGTVLVGVDAGGSKSLLFRRDLLGFAAVAGADPADELAWDAIAAYDPADAGVEFERLPSLEWHVRPAGD